MELDRIADRLATVPGVEAIALGGSHSRGEAGPQSDFDLGLYYQPGRLDVTALGERLSELDDRHKEDLLNPPDAWGPWINGGAWLTVDGRPVDILLRDLQRVEAVIGDCLAGRITVDWQAGHPFGFVNTIYAAETHYCRPVWQANTQPLDRLKRLLYSTGEYPPKMRAATIQRFLWEAWFSLATGRGPALRGEVHYAAGAAFRAVGSWVQVLYALNRRYLMNEKGALQRVEELAERPANFEARVNEAYRLLGSGAAEQAYWILDDLQAEVDALAGEIQPPGRTIR